MAGDRPYAEAARTYLAVGWKGPLPLPPREKDPVPTGYTGRAGVWPSIADVQFWIDTRRDANLAIRLPEDVVGVDADLYKPEGRATFARLAAELGSLPKTAMSTSRSDGSGIRLFRTRYRSTWRNPGKGVEIVHYGWRYVIAWPSIHPEDRLYRWVDERTGEILDAPPDPASLPALPAAYVERLSSDQVIEKTDVGNDEVKKWLDALPNGDPCPATKRALEDFLTALRSTGSRHDDALLPGTGRLVRIGERGCPGVTQALSEARAAFINAATVARTTDGKDRRTEQKAIGEWRRAIAGAIGIVKAKPTPAAERGCRCAPEFAALRQPRRPLRARRRARASKGRR